MDNDAAFGAKIMLIIQFGAVLTILTVLGHFFTEEQDLHLHSFLILYNGMGKKSTVIFDFSNKYNKYNEKNGY